MSIKCTVRRAREEDTEDLIRLCKEGISYCGLPEPEMDEAVLRRNIGLMLKGRGHLILVVEHSSPVGYAHCFASPGFHTDHLATYIPHLYVRPEYRSIRVIDDIVKEWVEWTKELGATCMNWMTMNGIVSKSYDRLVKKYGFRLTGKLYERFPL